MWRIPQLPAAKNCPALGGPHSSQRLTFLLLLLGLFEGWGGGTDSVSSLEGKGRETASQEPLTFQCRLISNFFSPSWTENLGSGWLGDVETHKWDTQAGSVIFLWPWARGHLRTEQWKRLQSTIETFLTSFTRDVQDFAKVFRLDYPFVIQIRVSYSQRFPVSFFQVAFQGSDFLSFQGDLWKPAPGSESTSQSISRILNQDEGTRLMLQSLLNHTLPQFLDGLLDTGRRDIERQVRPDIWLSSSSSPTSGQLKLLCHVSGFYPKTVRVTWIKNGQEQPGIQTSDLLPNSDGTWWLQVTLNLEAGKATNLACRVEHSSLGGQDLIRYWDKGSIWPLALGFSAVIIVVVLLVFGVIWWKNQHRSYEGIL